eukprot:SAG31_NODE_11340_length_1040_cov_1.783209_2_plen_189_part_00
MRSWLSYAGQSADQTLEILATVIGGSQAGRGFALLITSDFKFGRDGATQRLVSAEAQRLVLQPAGTGLRNVTATTLSPTAAWMMMSLNDSQVALDLSAGVAGLSATTTAVTNTTLDGLLMLRKSMQKSSRAAEFVAPTPELAEAGGGMRAGLMWNAIWHPTQLGPFVEVSRSFATQPYEIFEVGYIYY